MIDLVVDPLVQYGFMRVGLTTAVIVGVTSAVLSCLLVVRHQALLGDAISHATLLGVAAGYLLAREAGILAGALIVAVCTGLLITYVERNSPVKLDAAMGICFTALFALGLAIISVAKPRGIDLFHILFGNVLGVSAQDLTLSAVSGGLVLAVVAVLFRHLHLWSFDPLMARSAGMRVAALEYVFTALLSATIVAALQAVGLVLVIAMLITPGATALLLTSRLVTMMAVAAGVGLLSAVSGLYGSFYVDVASGPAIVLAATACFAVAFFLAPGRGVVAQVLRRRGAGRRALDEDLVKALLAPDDGAPATPAVLAGRLGVSRQRVELRLRALDYRDLVRSGNGAVTLTAAGREEALRMVRAHRLLETYVHEAEGVPLHELHGIAERLEHEVTPHALNDIDRLLGVPSTDPHGHPIPRGDGRLDGISGRALTQQPAGEPATVAMVSDDRDDLLEAMVDLGILPQRQLTVLSRDNRHARVRIDGRDIDVPDEIGARIYLISP